MIQISLEAARRNAGLTQGEAAQQIGVTTQTILNWEKGRTEPSVTQGRKISAVYGIDLDYIFLPTKSN